MVSIIDEDSFYKYVTQKHAEFLGYPEKELLQRTSLEFVHPNDKRRLVEEFEKLRRTHRIMTSPFRFRYKKKEWRWMQSTATNMIKDPSINGVIINTTDIHEIIRAQNRLKASEEKYFTLFHNSPLPKLIYHPESLNIIEVNQTAITLYGYSYEEFLKKSLLDLIAPKDQKKAKEAHKKLKNSKKAVKLGHFKFFNKKGQPLEVELTSFNYKLAQRKAILAVCNDISTEHFYKQLEHIERDVMQESIKTSASLSSVLNIYT